jgi:hypothetical protein
MACSLTIDAVRARTKLVTRRRADTWQTLEAGDHLTLIERGMGLSKGETQVVLEPDVLVVSVRLERLSAVLTEPNATELEGLGQLSPAEFVEMWLATHGHRPDENPKVRRIEWLYPIEPSSVSSWSRMPTGRWARIERGALEFTLCTNRSDFSPAWPKALRVPARCRLCYGGARHSTTLHERHMASLT